MTISEILQRVRVFNNDSEAKKKLQDSYYLNMIIAAIWDLEPMMGKISIRDDSYQFLPIRDADGDITYKEDGVTPEIDSEIFYDPDDVDSHSPVDIFVNKGLKVATSKATGSIETADFLDGNGLLLREKDIVFIKIDAEVSVTSPDKVEFDISLDNRESWLKADHSIDIILDDAGTTGYIDVSKIPSSYAALKWKLTGASAIVKNTTFWRLYITRDKLRHYAGEVEPYNKLQQELYDEVVTNPNHVPTHTWTSIYHNHERPATYVTMHELCDENHCHEGVTSNDGPGVIKYLFTRHHIYKNIMDNVMRCPDEYEGFEWLTYWGKNGKCDTPEKLRAEYGDILEHIRGLK